MYKVSVVIPVYNVDDYIEETIESLLAQTLKEFEVILIDDGSTDKSIEKIEKVLKEHTNFKLFKQKNNGPSAARNKGIELAKGEYIAFMDSDDKIPKDSLEVRYNLAREKDVEVLICSTYKFNKNNSWPMKNHFLEEGFKDVKNDSDLYTTLGPCNKLFKRDLIEALRFPIDIKYAEDQVFVMEAYLKAKKIFASKYTAYYYRERPDDAAGSLTKQIIDNSSFVIEQVKTSWKLTKSNIEKYCENKYIANNITAKYFERLLSYDIWPPLKNAVVKGNEETQIKALNNMKNLIEVLDDNIINESRKFRWIIVQGIIHKYLFLKGNSKKVYTELLADTYKRFDANSKNILKVDEEYLYRSLEKIEKTKNNIYILKYLIRRKFDRLPKRIEGKIKRNLKIGFYIAKLFPTKKNNIIFATNKSNELSGNLKCINEELSKNKKYNVETYLINDEISFMATVRMYMKFGRAKYIVLDDYYRQLYGLKFKDGVEVIQVWHACGAFKKFGFSAIGKKDGNTLEFETNAHQHYTKVITSSKNIINEYSEAFNIEKEKVLPLGVPRTDILLNEEYKEFIKDELENEYPITKGKKLILYAPTFRGNIQQRQSFKLELDPTTILNALGEDYIIILKLHPSVKNGLEGIKIPAGLKERIIEIESGKDINDLIIASDIVITDYSSVVFEAALLDKKILMYAYDKEEYLGERDFYYEYDEFVPGEIAKTNEEIIEVIKKEKFDIEKVKNFKERFFDHTDGQASKRFVETIFK